MNIIVLIITVLSYTIEGTSNFSFSTPKSSVSTPNYELKFNDGAPNNVSFCVCGSI